MDGGAAHWPVLVQEVLTLLAPAGRFVLVDGTIGLGGHAEAMLEAAGERAALIGLDVDEGNLLLARRRLARFGDRVRLFQANFSLLGDVLHEANLPAADAVLADLGVSSNQLDDGRRGLSFALEGPLDMRLDDRLTKTAADLVNRLAEAELADLIFAYGEERYSRRIARAVVAARRQKRIESTVGLANLVAAAYPRVSRRSRRGVHPATRTFQALRIAVNDEMGHLERFLDRLPSVLAVGGRAAVISFHSLEDRRVKQAFARWTSTGTARLLNERVIAPTESEVRDNPRCRSAKLRGLERLA